MTTRVAAAISWSRAGRLPIRVVLKPLPCRVPGGLPAWAVMFEGKTIIPRAHDPEHEAARWLRNHGYLGPMETARADGTVSTRYPDLVRTADWSVSDRDSGGFLRRRYRLWLGEGSLRQHPSDAGRPRTPVPASLTVPTLAGAYDDGVAASAAAGGSLP